MVGELDVFWVWEGIEVDHIFLEPSSPGSFFDEFLFDFAVVDDASLFGVDEEDFTWLESPLFGDVFGFEGDDADLAGHDDEFVGGDVVSAGSESIAVEDCADEGAVGEGDGGGAVPGFHEAGVVFVEGFEVVAHEVVVLPGFRDEHEDGMGEGAAVDAEELESVVDGSGVGA